MIGAVAESHATIWYAFSDPKLRRTGVRVYRLDWYPDHMDFFLDGKKIVTYRKDPATGWSFDHPMYLIMNIACGGPDEPAPDDSELPQFMTVDYVRVYQQIRGLPPR
jgi:beta-glucanase (GH16 family)